MDLSKSKYVMLMGVCPDEQCQTTLYFPSHDSSIECTSCGQRHNKSRIQNIKEVTDHNVALHNILKNLLLGKFKPKKGTDSVKVLGVSNFQCKLLSPLLTRYGMDKATGKAKLLCEMTPPRESFSCGVLGDRSFQIEKEHVDVVGYGRDLSGSMIYLKDTLSAIKKHNGDNECVLPIHADGDGHCLVHAISRALIGRELFWHALRENLKEHLESHLDQYQALFVDFVENQEWSKIIAECDPQFLPLDGDTMGLRNIHIFGLANILKRPIILLDSLSGIRSSGDYSGLFLPGMCKPEDCRKGGVLNKPICIAWSSAGRNHYIALVGVKGVPLARLPAWMIPKVWGMPQEQASLYCDMEVDGSLTLFGDKCLTDKYILRLVDAMEVVFQEVNVVSTSLVADVHQYIYKTTGYVGVNQSVVLDHAQRAVKSRQLFRCLTCDALMEWIADPDWFRPGGLLYKLAVGKDGKLKTGVLYKFPVHGYLCSYDSTNDVLVPDLDKSQPPQCQFCQGSQMRQVKADGSVEYVNGDRTKNESGSTRCQCGFKHYWDGREYDNLPELIPISLEWGGKSIKDNVTWFQYESDVSMNSNVFDVATLLVQKHFPGEFGSERLVQKVVDTVLRQTAQQDIAQAPSTTLTSPTANVETVGGDESTDSSWRADTSSKIILTGAKKKTLHREELTMSNAEKDLKKRVETRAPLMQKRKNDPQPISPRSDGPHDNTNTPQAKATPKLARTGSNTSDSSGSVTSPSSDSALVRDHIKVRVTTSDGRQLTLTLAKDVTYMSLQQILCSTLDVPPNSFKVKCGFPPKLLVAPDGDVTKALSIQHGDRLMVDIIQEQPEIKTITDPSDVNWSHFDASSHDQSAQSMLSTLESLQSGHGNSLDASIASLSLMATLTGKDLWSYVQAMPHLFSVGGLYYQQVKRDLGLVNGKHCTLPSIKGKVFRYSEAEDRLELCLEPHGHFAVEPGIENKVLNSPTHMIDKPTADPLSLANTLNSGSIGVAVNKPMTFPGKMRGTQAFSGQAHSLTTRSADITMPGDVEMTTHHRHHHQGDQVTIHPGPEAILEEPDASDLAGNLVSQKSEQLLGDATSSDSNSATSPVFRRIGPGVTVLSDNITNDINIQAEVFHNLVSQIEQRFRDTENEEPSDMECAGVSEDSERGLSSDVSVGSRPKDTAAPDEDERNISEMDST